MIVLKPGEPQFSKSWHVSVYINGRKTGVDHEVTVAR